MATVLIGEDTADLGVVLGRILSRAGHEVRVERDGPTTLAAVRESVPDILVLDVLMPGMTGLEVCRAIRDDPGTAALPVLLVSACALEAEVAAGRAAGADDYLVKPFDNGELVARVETLLHRTA